MNYPPLIKENVRVILINSKKEILLFYINDPATTTASGKSNGPFWVTPGGGVEKGELYKDAIIREIKEETGLSQDDFKLGPKVWHGEFDLIVHGQLRRIKQQFFVAYTEKSNISMAGMYGPESLVVKKASWLSLQKIKELKEVVYPVLLPDLLQSILEGNLPKESLLVDLGKKPK